MLAWISIRNFGPIDKMEIEFQQGLTGITGESGAGKSFLLEALQLALGNKPGKKYGHTGTIDISACFLAPEGSPVQARLRSFIPDLDDTELVLRRTLGTSGRSRCWINSQPVNNSTLLQVGQCLCDITSQHQAGQLQNRHAADTQLDACLPDEAPLQQMQSVHGQWQSCKQAIKKLLHSGQNPAEQQLVQYQLEELDKLTPDPGEWPRLLQTQRQLDVLEEQRQLLESASALLDDTGCGLGAQIEILRQQADRLQQLCPEADNLNACIKNALIELEEARAEIDTLTTQLDTAPELAQKTSQRIESYYQLSRKHRVAPEALHEHWQELQGRLAMVDNQEAQLRSLQDNLAALEQNWHSLASQVSRCRQTAARKLSHQINGILPKLAMPGARFSIEFTPIGQAPSAQGLESATFLFSSAPKGPMLPIEKSASGGELARLCLLLRTACQHAQSIPVQVFDEIDAGLGGQAADCLGEHLMTLSQQAQVLCVTHQPQVAARADHHLRIQKDIKTHCSEARLLSMEERTFEVGRMISNAEPSDSALQHAKHLLKRSSGFKTAAA